jgi:membrane fusion protein, heavy metal efflux system
MIEDVETLENKSTPSPDPHSLGSQQPGGLNAGLMTPDPGRKRQRAGGFTILLVLFLAMVWFVWQALEKKKVPDSGAASAANHSADLVMVDDQALRQVRVAPVTERTVTLDRNTTGRISFNEDHLTPVFTPFAGRVLELLANKGDQVSKDQPLLVLESSDLVSAQNDLASARSDVNKAKIGLDFSRVAADRARRLYEREALAAKDLQQSEADLARAQDEDRRAQAALASVEGRIALFGKKPEEIQQLGKTLDRKVILRSPMSGTIVDRKVGPGQYIKPDSPDPLFLITDLSSLWIQADVFESDIAWAQLHAPVEISVDAFPDKVFTGHISFISPTVDPSSRTVRVRCLIGNENRLLKPDMFARIKILAAASQRMAELPAAAVITEGAENFVFVEESHGRFRRRAVQVKRDADGMVLIESGINPGERVVTAGGLLINELKKDNN